jgi:aminopeptidase YwaD
MLWDMLPLRVQTRNVMRHLDVLCSQIGMRYSGTQGEREGAEYIASQMRRYGLQVKFHEFEFLNWLPCNVEATLLKGGKEKRIQGIGEFVFSQATPPGGVEGELVFLESDHDAHFRSRRLRGKIGLVIGAIDVSKRETAIKFMESGLKGVIYVDNRIPFPWKAPIGMAPQWRDDFYMPVVSAPYLKAIELEKEIPARVRLNIDCWTGMNYSQNVIGEIRGSHYPEEIIVVSSHLDSVLGNVGADDNASGCVFVLELARLMARLKPKRTIRFICYGVEEKLSVGAYLYMRSLERSETRRIILCLNADSIASRVGGNIAYITGAPELHDYFREQFDQGEVPVETRDEVNPYSDHFPLNICGVPSVWATRANMLGSYYWALHSQHDNLNNVSPKILAQISASYAKILHDLVSRNSLPFARKIASKQMRKVKEIAQEVYRHPWNPKQA